MKQKDLALIIMIVAISAVASYFLSNALPFGSPKSRQQKYELVQPINDTFPEVGTDDYKNSLGKYFNNTAFDPTQTINIGPASNTDPFKNTDQTNGQ